MWRFTWATYGSKIVATRGVYPIPAVRMTVSSVDRKLKSSVTMASQFSASFSTAARRQACSSPPPQTPLSCAAPACPRSFMPMLKVTTSARPRSRRIDSSYRLVVAQGVEQLGARLAALTQVDNVDSSARVGLDVGRVTLHVATASAHANGQGVAEGHVVPGSGDGGNRRILLASGRFFLSSRSARMPLRDRRWPMRRGVPDVIVGPVRALFPGDRARRQARQQSHHEQQSRTPLHPLPLPRSASIAQGIIAADVARVRPQRTEVRFWLVLPRQTGYRRIPSKSLICRVDPPCKPANPLVGSSGIRCRRRRGGANERGIPNAVTVGHIPDVRGRAQGHRRDSGPFAPPVRCSSALRG